MDLEYYGLFLVGSILVSLGMVVIALAALLINHLYTKYWKTVQLFKIYSYDLDGGTPDSNTITISANTESTK
jgi:hypothetical protein